MGETGYLMGKKTLYIELIRLDREKWALHTIEKALIVTDVI